MNTKIISFANEKGGVGKTTVTEMVATWIYYMTDISVAIVDIDPQQTISYVRKSDLEALESTNLTLRSKKLYWFKEQTSNRKLYPVFSLPDASKFQDLYERELKNYQVVFLDLPGTVDKRQESILPLIQHIFIPTHVDHGTVNSSVQYAVTILKNYAKYQKDFNLRTMRFFSGAVCTMDTIQSGTFLFGSAGVLTHQKSMMKGPF